MNRIKKIIKYTVVAILSLGVIWVLNFLVIGNFHKVDKDVYRSAQLFEFNMPYYLEKHKIKSIINLRGHSTRDWYVNEKSIASKYGVEHFDFGFSDRSVQSFENMQKLVELIKKAPKPLLIHCKAGADRASLASALYLLEVKNDKDASKQISLKFGHFPYLGSKTKAMGESFDNYIKNINELDNESI